jgi:hypothetical protein
VWRICVSRLLTDRRHRRLETAGALVLAWSRGGGLQ